MDHIGLVKFGNSIRGVLIDPKINIFNVKKRWTALPKHWAIILELSNGSYVNIQFGRKGFSLKEYNKEETQLEGENLLNSILEIWGKEDIPCSFCYLGNAKYEYEKLKAFLKIKKIEEKESKKKSGKIYYHITYNNCHDFVYEIEKILFNKNPNYSFKYYLDKFYEYFFPKVDIKKLKLKYEKYIMKKIKKIQRISGKI